MEKKFISLRKGGSPDDPPPKGGEPAAPPIGESRIPKRRSAVRAGAPAAPSNLSELEGPSLAEQEQPEIAAPIAPVEATGTRILVVHDAASSYRLVEETFRNFTSAKVDSTADVLTAFDLAMVRDYQLFIIALRLPELSGTFFYELISRAYQWGQGGRKLAPAVVFVREANEPFPPEDVVRDVRVKAVWSKPLNIEKMLDSVSGIITRTDL